MTDELNHSLALRLASEFQGYARDLHNEAVATVTGSLAQGNPKVRLILRIPYVDGRRLDRGNAEPGGLAHDFSLFGMEFWPDLERAYPARAPGWRERLRLLHEARNGLAHDDAARVAKVVAAGWRLNLSSVRRWRGALDGLAGAMDHVVGGHLHRLYGVTPW